MKFNWSVIISSNNGCFFMGHYHPYLESDYTCHKRMSVTVPRLGTCLVWLQHPDGFSSPCCHALGTSSAISMNSKSKIFFTSFGGRAVVIWVMGCVGNAVLTTCGDIDIVVCPAKPGDIGLLRGQFP